MTIRRAVLYIAGASLLVAWLSSAASVSRQWSQSPPSGRRVESVPPGDVIADVQAKARRLKERLASAPAPQEPLRNPFAFRSSARQPPTPREGDISAESAPHVEALEPVLNLIGVAEDRTEQGVVRTAMFATGDDELIMAATGDVVMTRYTVTAVSADAVELTDATTGRVRRLTLQYQ